MAEAEKKTKPANQRGTARLGAVQALYQMDVGGQPSKAVIFEFRNHRFGHEDEPDMIVADEDFFEAIILGVVAGQADIDKTIADHLSAKWSLKRLDITLRAIMREAWEGIQSQNFTGCGEDDCEWCRFVADLREEVPLEREDEVDDWT